jgi:hypothetical protein
MTLVNLTDFPPGGYQFNQPQIPWEAPQELASQGLEIVARALQQVRINNPNSGLDPSFEACLNDVAEFQCARFQHKPKLLAKFCGDKSSALAQAAAVKQRGCGGCGGNR